MYIPVLCFSGVLLLLFLIGLLGWGFGDCGTGNFWQQVSTRAGGPTQRGKGAQPSIDEGEGCSRGDIILVRVFTIIETHYNYLIAILFIHNIQVLGLSSSINCCIVDVNGCKKVILLLSVLRWCSPASCRCWELSLLPAGPPPPAVCWMKTHLFAMPDWAPREPATSAILCWTTRSSSPCWSSLLATSKVSCWLFINHNQKHIDVCGFFFYLLCFKSPVCKM